MSQDKKLQRHVKKQESHSIQTRNVWHRRLGHIGNDRLNDLIKSKCVKDLDCETEKSTESSLCQPCVAGKLSRKPFPKKSERKSSHPLELVHSDVCGKIENKSLGNAEYFVTFTDDASRYVWMYVLKKKSEVFEIFKNWKALVENETGYKLKTYRTDNGGENCSAEMIAFLKNEGIKHELTVPKTPQQNGVREQLNCTLMETVRAMLADSNLDKKFWADALNTEVYLKNRTPTSALDKITPYEALTGQQPSVEHLRIFGCSAYAHIPKDERRKLDAKSRKCTFLGYSSSSKGYRLYDLEKKESIY